MDTGEWQGSLWSALVRRKGPGHLPVRTLQVQAAEWPVGTCRGRERSRQWPRREGQATHLQYSHPNVRTHTGTDLREFLLL